MYGGVCKQQGRRREKNNDESRWLQNESKTPHTTTLEPPVGCKMIENTTISTSPHLSHTIAVAAALVALVQALAVGLRHAPLVLLARRNVGRANVPHRVLAPRRFVGGGRRGRGRHHGGRDGRVLGGGGGRRARGQAAGLAGVDASHNGAGAGGRPGGRALASLTHGGGRRDAAATRKELAVALLLRQPAAASVAAEQGLQVGGRGRGQSVGRVADGAGC